MLEYIFKVLEWCKVVIFLREKDKKVLFKEGEIWWCSVGMNVGAEIFGEGPKFERPVLILKKLHADLFFGIPITSQIKKGNWYVPIHYGNTKATVVLNQSRTLDAKRLTERLGTLTEEQFQTVKQAFLDFHGPSNVRPSSQDEGTVGNPKDTIILPPE